MADPAHIAAHDLVGPTIPQSDDEPIYSTPHRELVTAAGRLARAEQAKLEKLLGLDNGRTRRPG
jgi:hypothetical protein